MPLTPRQAATLELHRQLDQVPSLNRRFISGYETTHPFIDRYLKDIGAEDGYASRLGTYCFAQDQVALVEAIRRFHQRADEIDYAPDQILLSAGSSPLLLTLMVFLRRNAVRSLYYFRPIYHSFYFFADLLGVDLLPLSEHLLVDNEVSLTLPDGNHVLLFSDPIWIAGRELNDGVIDKVRRWQERTGSIVLVDGTFQYLKWEWPASKERSTQLVRDQTIRLICPTKSLALHGIRFAYLLGPARLLDGLRWVCDNATGSASGFDLHAAVRLMEVLLTPDRNRHLGAYLRDRYTALRASNFITETAHEPDCGYYILGKLGRPEKTDLLMNGNYFELQGYDDFVRINLLSPDVKLIPTDT